MTGFNLSRWALHNKSVVTYLMLLAVVAGVLAFVKLGRNEDPAFTIRTMVVAAGWPGATLEETTLQVTERIERQLQELPGLDNIRSYTQPGRTTIFVNLLGSVTAAEVPPTWQRVRNDVNDIWHTLPRGTLGPFFNDRFGDVFGIIYGFTADGFTHRELRDYVEQIRSELLHVPDVTKIDILGAQDEVIFVEFSMQQLASLGIDRQALLAAIRTQNDVRPAGIIETGDERISLRVTGAFQSEQDLLDINFVAGGRMIRLSDIATVRRGYADPPQPMFRVGGEPAIGLGIAMRDGGDVLALGANIDAALTRIRADLPLGIEPHLVANQPATVEIAIGEFMESLWQAVAIILGMSFLSLGVRPGLVVALAIPLTLAIVFALMLVLGIDMQRISLGALIIALALMVDDAMTTTDATLTRLAAGDSKPEASMFAFETYAFSMLAGTLVTIAGFVPIGFAQSSAGEYCFTLFAVVTVALLVSWLVAVIFAPLLSLAILKVPEPGPPPEPPRVVRWYRDFLTVALRARWLTIAVTLGLFVGSVLLLPLIPRQFFPRPIDRSCWSISTCRRTPRSSPRTAVGPLRRSAEGRSGRRAMEHLGRPGRHPLLPAARCAARQPVLRPGGHRRQGHRRARPAARQARADAGGGFPRRRRCVFAAGVRSAGRLADPVPGERTRSLGGPLDRPRSRRSRCRQPRYAAHQLRLGRAHPGGAHPGRPGRGAPARPEFGGAGGRAQHGHHRRARDAGPRRHLSGQRAGSCDGRAARLAHHPAHLAGAAAERADGGAQSVREFRVRRRISR